MFCFIQRDRILKALSLYILEFMSSWKNGSRCGLTGLNLCVFIKHFCLLYPWHQLHWQSVARTIITSFPILRWPTQTIPLSSLTNSPNSPPFLRSTVSLILLPLSLQPMSFSYSLAHLLAHPLFSLSPPPPATGATSSGPPPEQLENQEVARMHTDYRSPTEGCCLYSLSV